MPFVAESIDGEGVRLRRPRESDVPGVAAACRDPLTRRFLPLLPDPYTEADALDWVTGFTDAAFAAGGGCYVVVDPVDDALLAGVGVTAGRGGEGGIGYWVAPWARRRGVAGRATRVLTAYAFAAGLERLVIRTAWDNPASQRVAIAAGYRREAELRGAVPGRGGRRDDVVQWARLAGDPAGPSPRLLPDLPDGRLTDGVVALRRLGPADADESYALHRLPEVVASTVPPEPPSPAEVTAWCGHAEAQWLAGTRAPLVITDVATGAFAGEISLYYAEPGTGQAMVGYDVAPAWRGRGYATRAVRLLASWAFGAARVARLVAGAAPENEASQRVLRAAGFTREGYQRGRLPGPGGGRVDDVLYALLPGDLTVTPPGS